MPSKPSIALVASLLVAAPASAAQPTAVLRSHYATGSQPSVAKLLDDGANLAVANRGDNTVSMFRTSDMSLLRTYAEVGFGPWGMAAPDAATLVVANWTGERLSFLDRASGKVTGTIQVGIKPSYVATSPDGTRAFAAGNLTGDVTIIELGTRVARRTVEVGQKPMGVAVSPDGRWLYVACCSSRLVSKVDLKHEVVLERFGAPLARTTNLALTPDGSRLLAAGDDNRLLVIDTERGAVDGVRVGGDPAAVTLSPDGTTAFVALYGADAVALVDLAARVAYAEVPVGRGPIHVETDGRRLYTCNDRADSVTVLDLRTGGLEPAPTAAPTASGQ
jgi:DNA-binding beta-propeller fold protein YncE